MAPSSGMRSEHLGSCTGLDREEENRNGGFALETSGQEGGGPEQHPEQKLGRMV